MKFILLLALLCSSAFASQPDVYTASNKGKFIAIKGINFCTHDGTNFAYSFDLKKNGYVDSLLVLDKESGEIEKYAYVGWTNHGLLWDSRIFTAIEANTNFPNTISLRATQGGGNDVFHLSSFIDQDHYVVQGKDAGFTVSSIAAYKNIFECDKK